MILATVIKNNLLVNILNFIIVIGVIIIISLIFAIIKSNKK